MSRRVSLLTGSNKSRSVTLCTTEAAGSRKIELGMSKVDLLSPLPITGTIPAFFPFAIPLTPDTPQCIHTPRSALVHTLTARLHPVDPAVSVVSKEVTVHTRRYTSHTYTVETLPETHVLEHPVRAEIEIPRSTFMTGEPIPLYITIPPPRCELVIHGDLRLRNVKVELVRVIEIMDEDDHDMVAPAVAEHADEDTKFLLDGPSSTVFPPEKPRGDSTLATGEDSDMRHTTILVRSGASCRFHRTKPVRLRLILHQPPPRSDVYQADHEFDSQCISITQTTLVHRVSFRLDVQASFTDARRRTEQMSTLSIPVVIVPSPAPLPEVDGWVDVAYQKKHDRPPARTVRHEDPSVPTYEEGQAGPSYTNSGEPPPFEDRDMPPPPFPSETRLPTFQESEDEIYIPENTDMHTTPSPEPMLIVGEGVLFGFLASQQFDGYCNTLQQASTPPPSVQDAAQDPDLTDLAGMVRPHHGLVLEQREDPPANHGSPPPPPPLLDDPSDPPPSIDSDFRSRGSLQMRSSAHHSFVQLRERGDSMSPPQDIHPPSGDAHAPPPYLTSNQREQVNATPPPYIAFARPPV